MNPSSIQAPCAWRVEICDYERLRYCDEDLAVGDVIEEPSDARQGE